MAVVQTMEQGGLEKGMELSDTERHGLHQHLWQRLSTGSLHDGRAEKTWDPGPALNFQSPPPITPAQPQPCPPGR